MSKPQFSPRIQKFMQLKFERKIVCLTAYTAPMAAALDPHCDLLLVGDSLAMTIYGLATTRDIDLDTMIRHGAAVNRRAKNALVIVDLPAGTYEADPETATIAAQRMIAETGADGVKLEGGVDLAPHVTAITEAGIPVMGHIGLLPQQAQSISDFRITGRTGDEARQLRLDMDALITAGAFSIVLEGVIESVARDLATQCAVPTIGIGASGACDGQILVSDDMLGMFDSYVPKFVQKFADMQTVISEATREYRDAVIDQTFPSNDNLYRAKSEVE